jgi:hypothetical protein
VHKDCARPDQIEVTIGKRQPLCPGNIQFRKGDIGQMLACSQTLRLGQRNFRNVDANNLCLRIGSCKVECPGARTTGQIERRVNTGWIDLRWYQPAYQRFQLLVLAQQARILIGLIQQVIIRLRHYLALLS